jgi:hypothetical protein
MVGQSSSYAYFVVSKSCWSFFFLQLLNSTVDSGCLRWTSLNLREILSIQRTQSRIGQCKYDEVIKMYLVAC